MCSHTSELSLDVLGDRICELAAHIASATCRWLLMIAEFDEREGWAEWGTYSCAHWLSWRCSIGARAAREHVRVARRLRELPLIREAFAAGELSYCKVRALTRIATDRIEPDLLELARNATGAQLEQVVRGYSSALAANAEGANELHARRYLRWEWRDDGSFRLEGRLSPEDGALVLQALQAAEEPIRDQDGGDAGSARADALVSVARAALAAGGDQRTGGDPAEVVVHVDAETLAGETISSRSEIAGGPSLAPETARRLACDASVVRIIERDGEPLSVGRRTRSIPPALRRAIRARDHGCRFPGCEHTRFLHAHHIHHWARGGRTELANLVQLCSYHHRLVHEGGYTVARSRGQTLTFCRPNGQPIPQAPVPSRRGPDIETQHTTAGREFDSDTCRPRCAGDKLDYGLAVELLLHRESRPPPAWITV